MNKTKMKILFLIFISHYTLFRFFVVKCHGKMGQLQSSRRRFLDQETLGMITYSCVEIRTVGTEILTHGAGK